MQHQPDIVQTIQTKCYLTSWTPPNSNSHTYQQTQATAKRYAKCHLPRWEGVKCPTKPYFPWRIRFCLTNICNLPREIRFCLINIQNLPWEIRFRLTDIHNPPREVTHLTTKQPDLMQKMRFCCGHHPNLILRTRRRWPI